MCTILVIEDDEALLLFMEKLLELKGFNVLTADQGKLGLELANKNIPDLIICDILMPDINGYEVIKEIRKNPVTEAIPFIFLTGINSAKNLREGMNLGADDYLTKPFTKEDLFSAINIRLEKKNTLERHSQEPLNILRHNLTTAFPHEFRTPLQNIILATDYLEIIADNSIIDPLDIKEIIGIFRESSQRLLNLSQKFLFYSSLESKVLEPREQDNFVANLQLSCVGDIIKSVALKQAQNYQRIEDLNFDVEEGCIVIQEDFFRALLTEIIDNSLKFSSLETPIDIKTYNQENFYIINVTNQGRGFLPDQLKNIGAYIQFERGKYEQQGPGLGLAIVEKILTLYHGFLEIKSIPDQSTSLIIKLPLVQDKEVGGKQ